MAAINTANSNSAVAAPTAVKSPLHAAAVDGVSSPQSRRATRAVSSSPWTQIVRGESEPIAAVPSSPSASASASAAVTEPAIAAGSSSSSSPPPSASSSPSLVEETGVESSESGSGPNGNVGKRPAWNKPSNGAAEVGPVMGAVSWPALSESARAATKLSSESLKGLSDGLSSVPVSQGSGTPMSTTTSSQKLAHPTSTPMHAASSRQRSMKRNNSNTSSNGGLPQQQAPASQIVDIASNNPSPKDHTQRSGFGSHSHSSGDHPQQRNSFRNRSGGQHPRGDGSHHHNYGGRRDQDRGNHDWNNHRSFNGRDPHLQQQRVFPRVHRGPTPQPPSAPFISPLMRPYATPPMGYPGELGGQLLYVAHPPPPFGGPISPMFIPGGPDPHLPSKIVNQIEYYFSNQNLVKDTFLRNNMDDQGWVPIKLIAGFNKVMQLTDNIQLILDALRMSNLVEVQGDRVRRRNDWMNWLMPGQFPNVSSPRTPGKSSPDMLAAHVQRLAVGDQNTNNSSSGQSNYQPQLSGGDETGQFSVQAGADHSFSGRN